MSIDANQSKNCACFNLRATTRAVTQAFDDILGPSGLTISQYTLLSVLAIQGPATINEIAAWLRMDATTLTRGLKPLIKEKLVASMPGVDQRTRHVALTQAGQRALEEARPLWQTIQTKIVEGMGEERFEVFLKDLNLVASLVH
jgi:DNA-binding MarR family transcriptional regulator